jgi:hypothetical protein
MCVVAIVVQVIIVYICICFPVGNSLSHVGDSTPAAHALHFRQIRGNLKIFMPRIQFRFMAASAWLAVFQCSDFSQDILNCKGILRAIY